MITGCLADLENLEDGPLLRKIRGNLENQANFSKKNNKPGKVGEIYFPEGELTQIFQFLQTLSEFLRIHC